MWKFYKIIGLGLISTIMVNVLMGCGSKQAGQVQPKEDHVPKVEIIADNASKKSDQQAVTIRTVSQFGDTDPSVKVYKAKIEEFKAENPMVTVEDESEIADEKWKAKVAADFAAKNEPDVIFTFTGLDAKAMIKQDRVVSLEEIKEEFPDYASNISQVVLRSVEEFDGKTYAVPVKGFYQGLFINKALFKEHNLELPTDWEKLEMAIISLGENNIVPIAAALGDVPHYWVEHLIFAKGGVEVHGNQDIAVVKDEWIKGLEYFKSLYELGAFSNDTKLATNDEVIEMFANEDAAMLLHSNWVISGFENPDNITVLPIPPVPGGAKDTSDIISGFQAGWYITRAAWDKPEKRLAAIRFVEKMTSTDTITEFITEGGAPSTDIGLVEGLSAVAIDGFKMQAAAKNIDKPIESWLAKPAWDYLISLIPAIATGDEDISEVVDGVIKLNKI